MCHQGANTCRRKRFIDACKMYHRFLSFGGTKAPLEWLIANLLTTYLKINIFPIIGSISLNVSVALLFWNLATDLAWLPLNKVFVKLLTYLYRNGDALITFGGYSWKYGFNQNLTKLHFVITILTTDGIFSELPST